MDKLLPALSSFSERLFSFVSRSGGGFRFKFRLLNIAALVVAVLATTLPAQTQSPRILPWTDDYLNRGYDWVIYINLNRLDNYLKYQGSTMPGMTRLFIDYRLTPNRPRNKNLSTDRTKYEDLWYQDDKAVGCRRYNDLNVPTQEQGCIYVKPDPLMSTNVKPVVNAIIRLVLELYYRKCIVTCIVVPKDNFDNVASALGLLNFFRLDVAYPGGPGENMSLHLMTDPIGIERYFYYDDTGRRGPSL